VRPSFVALAVVDVLLLTAASVSALTIDPLVYRVRSRPWPARVTPTGPWSATMTGSGARFTMTRVNGAIPDALDDVTVRLPDNGIFDPLNLTLPDGTTWRPKGGFRLETTGPLEFTSVRARGGTLDLDVESLQGLLGRAEGPITAVGTFAGPAGQQVDRLPLPATTRVGEDCGRPTCGDPFPKSQPEVSLPAARGLAVRASAGTISGEVAVAGTARAEALGRTWDGLVGALEGTGLDGTATWDGQRWSVEAHATGARQVWMDVWPVADTTISASSGYDAGTHSCFRDCRVRLRWSNTGFATSAILEAEGVGSGSGSVRFGLTPTSGHDAGLGVRRGGVRKHLADGGDIGPSDSPKSGDDRGLTTLPGSNVTLILRGNFPEVSVRLATSA
jgi:hypothetical protein